MSVSEWDEEGAAILFYDGHCLMCSSAIRWLMKRDSEARFRFAALQDPDVQPLLSEAPEAVQSADSVVLYREGQFYMYSEAVLKSLQLLGGIYKLSAVAYILPKSWRDHVYRWVARNRTRWFGRSEQCFLVPEERRSQFLSDPRRDWSDSPSEEE